MDVQWAGGFRFNASRFDSLGQAQLFQSKIPQPRGIAFSPAGDLYDVFRDDLRDRVVAIREPQAPARVLEGRVHDLNSLRVEGFVPEKVPDRHDGRYRVRCSGSREPTRPSDHRHTLFPSR